MGVKKIVGIKKVGVKKSRGKKLGGKQKPRFSSGDQFNYLISYYNGSVIFILSICWKVVHERIS